MAETATAPQTQTDPNLDVLAMALSGRPVAAPPPAPTAPAPAPEPADPAKTLSSAIGQSAPVTTQVPPAGTAPEVPTGTTAAPQEEMDDFTKALLGVQQTVEWNEDAKKLFKATYGEDDPLAFKQKYQETLTQAEVLKKQAEEAEALKASLKRVEDSNPALHAAILEELEGRDGLAYISKLPNANILGKKPTDLNDETLLRTYLGDKFTEDEWKAYRTGDYDDIGLTKEIMEAKVKALRPVAEHMHETRNQEYRSGIQQREEAYRQQREKYNQVVVQSVSKAQEDPFAKLYLNQETIEAFRSGTLSKGLLTDEDGATPHPNMLAALIKAKHFDEAVKRAFEAGKKAGEQRGLKQGVAQLPTPGPGGRVTAPADGQKVDPYAETLAKALNAR